MGSVPVLISSFSGVAGHKARTRSDRLSFGEVGANAVIAFRYDATEFVQGSTEVLAYGTAVKIEKV
jgi:hypothetical protein